MHKKLKSSINGMQVISIMPKCVIDIKVDSLKKIGCFSVNTEMQETRALSNAYFPIFTNTSSSCFQGDDPVGRFLWAFFSYKLVKR